MQLAAIALSFAVIGFVAGWVVRGDDGTVTDLPPAAAELTTSTDADGEPDGEPTTTAEPPATLPPRSDVSLIVLNGGTVNGLAAQTAAEAEGLGYADVISDNAPTQSGPTVVYFTDGNQAVAERAATDLELGPVDALPQSGELALAASQAAPSGSDVVVVLGTT